MDRQAAITIFFIGNASRGDDAAAPALLEKLLQQDWFIKACRNTVVNPVEVFQLQPELVYDMKDSSIVLFVDADQRSPGALLFEQVHPDTTPAVTTHSVEPGQLPAFFQSVFNKAAPPAFLIGIGGQNFTLGEPVSTTTLGNLSRASELLQKLVTEPDPDKWKEYTCKTNQPLDPLHA